MQRCDFSTCEPARYRAVKVNVLETIMLNHVTSNGWAIANTSKFSNHVDQTVSRQMESNNYSLSLTIGSKGFVCTKQNQNKEFMYSYEP